SSSPGRTASRSTSSATCSKSDSARNGSFSQARDTRCSGWARPSTRRLRISSSAPHKTDLPFVSPHMEATATPVAARPHVASPPPAAAPATAWFGGPASAGPPPAGPSSPPAPPALGRPLAPAVVPPAVFAARGERLPSRDDLRAVGVPLLIAGLLWFGAYNLM